MCLVSTWKQGHYREDQEEILHAKVSRAILWMASTFESEKTKEAVFISVTVPGTGCGCYCDQGGGSLKRPQFREATCLEGDMYFVEMFNDETSLWKWLTLLLQSYTYIIQYQTV